MPTKDKSEIIILSKFGCNEQPSSSELIRNNPCTENLLEKSQQTSGALLRLSGRLSENVWVFFLNIWSLSQFICRFQRHKKTVLILKRITSLSIKSEQIKSCRSEMTHPDVLVKLIPRVYTSAPRPTNSAWVAERPRPTPQRKLLPFSSLPFCCSRHRRATMGRPGNATLAPLHSRYVHGPFSRHRAPIERQSA